MKKSSYIVNVARGGIIQTNAITQALKENIIAGAGLDVTEPEPLPDDRRQEWFALEREQILEAQG